MRTLYAGISTPLKPGIVGRIQMLHVPFTHTFHRSKPTVEGRQQDNIYHTVGAGTFSQAFETFIQGRTLYAEFAIKLEDEVFADFCDEAMRTAGTHYYPRIGNVGLAIAYALKLAFNPFDWSKRWRRCSETSARIAAQFYDAKFDGRNFNTITPGMFLAEHLKLERERPGRVRLVAGTLYEQRIKGNGTHTSLDGR